jgi:predicted ArsR family transcriptional regulator
MSDRLASGVAPLATLENPLRRSIYEHVRARRTPVTREEVAEAVGISRRLAAFHLDVLLEQGLLVAHYARPPGRSGPGAGRSSKMYQPSDLQIDVSLPERRYDVAGRLLVRAITRASEDEAPADAALRVARDEGTQVGETVRSQASLGKPGPERTISAAREVLTELGYEPEKDAADELSLHNCPFHSLAKQEPDLICGMNQAFLDGMLRGMGNESIEAALTCVPGDCCVTLRRHGAEKGPATDGTGGDPEGSGLPKESSAPLPQ